MKQLWEKKLLIKTEKVNYSLDVHGEPLAQTSTNSEKDVYKYSAETPGFGWSLPARTYATPSPTRSIQRQLRGKFGFQPESTSASHGLKRPWFSSPTGDRLTTPKLTRAVEFSKFDGTLRPGGDRNFVREDTWSLKIPETQLNRAGLTEALADRANIVGLEEMVLTDRYRKPISDAAGKADLESPLQKLYAAPRTNYEKHFGQSDMTLAEKLVMSPPKKKWRLSRSQSAGGEEDSSADKLSKIQESIIALTAKVMAVADTQTAILDILTAGRQVSSASIHVSDSDSTSPPSSPWPVCPVACTSGADNIPSPS